MRILKYIILLAFFFLSLVMIEAQEVLIELPYNSTIKQANKHTLNQNSYKLKSAKVIDLPIIEDFSLNSIYPDPDLWENKHVFINNTYAINPPSIGVATFDALNEKGEVYRLATAEPFAADTLLSKPMNMHYSADSNVFFSFFYQPQGRGNAPEPGDSLVLDFLNNRDSIWIRQWGVGGSTNHAFKQVFIPITDSVFLRNGFQFRFINYASLSIIEESEGLNANADQWHIDYIKIDKNRSVNDTVINDICFVYPIESIIPDYESIPWDHFQNAVFPEFPYLYLKYANRDTIIRKATSRFSVTDLVGNTGIQDHQVWSSNLEPDELLNAYYKTGAINYNDNDSTRGLFEIKGYLEIDEEYDHAENDTTIYYQRFEDYYAYDDGTSENGYGILSKNSLIALQFKPVTSGALKAIRISFNHTKDTSYTQNKYFYLTIWDDNNGEPGDTLYQQIGTRPEFTHTLNGFHEYVLTRDVLVSGTFYIGLEQTTGDMLNIGFDVNRNSRNKLFYNLDGTWRNSIYKGALMMRPVFGEPNPIKEENINKSKKIAINPVPSNNTINIWIDGELIDEKSVITIYNQYGTLVSNNIKISESFNVAHLQPGIYIIRVLDSEGYIATGKFVVIN